MKHTFTRNNKVVPLPTKCCQDESEPQPGPSGLQSATLEDPEDSQEPYPTVEELLRDPLLLYLYPDSDFPAPWRYEQTFLDELDNYSEYTAIMFRMSE